MQRNVLLLKLRSPCFLRRQTSGWTNSFSLLSKPDHSDESLTCFESWLLNHGVSYQDHVTIKATSTTKSEGRTCVANCFIEPETHVIKIPMRCLINSTSWQQSAIGQIANESGVDTGNGNLFLTLALIQHWANQNKETFHTPYINILPRRLPHIPLFWDDSDLKYLQGSPMLTEIATQKLQFVEEFAQILETAKKHQTSNDKNIQNAVSVIEKTSVGDFAIAAMTVSSRAFEVHGAGKGGRVARCLVPLADMFNTALPHTCDVDFKVLNISTDNGKNEDKKEPHFIMQALHQIQPGQQIYDSYGYKSNHRYFLNYGFSFIENLRHDGQCPNETSILVGTSCLRFQDTTNSEVAKMWGDLALKITLSIPVGNDEAEARGMQLLCLLRFLSCSNNEVDRLKATHLRGTTYEEKSKWLPKLVSLPKLSEENENAAWKHFGVLCQDALGQYPTTLEEDDAVIKACAEGRSNLVEKFSNEWNALVQVLSEKQVLNYWKQRAQSKHHAQ